MIGLKATLLKIVGRIKDMSVYLTAIGVMALPIGVLLAIEKPSWEILASWLVVIGVIFVILGLISTIKEEQKKRVEAKKEERQKRIEDKQRRRESQAYLLVLSEIAKKQGVSMRKVARTLERWADEEKTDDDEEVIDEV